MHPIKTFAFLLGLVAFSSCRSHYATLYESPLRYHSAPKARRKIELNLRKIEVAKPVIQVSDLSKTSTEIKEVPAYFPEINTAHSRVVIPVIPIRLKKATEQIQKPKPVKKKKKKKGKIWRQMGSNLLIGLVFLGIAIGLTILHLESLALLFGLASILFLIFGLKKVFKKRRRKIRNPFQKNR